MSKLAALALSVLFVSSAFAASYKQTFRIKTPVLTCKVEHGSRSIGREINVTGDPALILKAGTSQGASMATTRVNDLSAFDYSQSCEGLSNLPKTLVGERELHVQKTEADGVCNAIVIEEILVKLGRSGAYLHGKTAWPVVGDDLSAYTKKNCKLKERDFKNAILEALAK